LVFLLSAVSAAIEPMHPFGRNDFYRHGCRHFVARRVFIMYVVLRHAFVVEQLFS
jgi:hypothetical protein